MKIILFLLNLIYLFKSDLLSSSGLSSGDYSSWIKESTTSPKNIVTVLTDDSNEQFIRIEKPSDKELSFDNDEGIWIKFSETQPRHIRFQYSSTNKETEDTNLRLKFDSENQTAVSFRCGHAGFVRVNEQQMVDFYNSTVSSIDTTSPKWTQCDVLLDWEDKQISIFLDQKFKEKADFYHDKIAKVDKVQLYNLKPGTVGYFRNIEVCQDICPNFSQANILKSMFLVSILMYILTLL